MEMPDSDASALRRVMRGVPSPVTIVTATGAGETRGTTIGSFSSVSLAPPLVSFNVDRESQMHGVIAEAAHFAVHLPGHAQAPLCTRFALPGRTGEEQLRDVPHAVDAHGTPVLADVRAVIKCRAHDRFAVGDHSIIIGEVTGVESGDENDARHDEKTPVLYYQRAYHRLARQPDAAPDARAPGVS